MTASDQQRDPATDHAGEAWLEAPLAAFEQAWWGGAPPPLAEFIPATLPESRRRIVAIELVKLDLSFRQQAGSPGAARLLSLERYVERFPLLGSLRELPADLIAEEFLARCRAGERPSVEEYVARFPAQGGVLREWLSQVESARQRELRQSGKPAPRSHLASTPRSRFVLKRLLGSGGLARVYSAVDTTTGEPVAVKLLKKSYWSHPVACERIAEEAEILRALAVPGVVGYREHGLLARSGPFLACELVLGRDLQRAFTMQPPTIQQIVSIAGQLREILAAIHAQGVIHADLKPGNIILSENGHITLVDFGFAVRRNETTRTWPLPRGGTRQFLAPELLTESVTSIDPRLDVYGFGSVLHGLLVQATPANTDAGETLHERLWELSQICLHPNPSNRPECIPQVKSGHDQAP